jgi:hypothetical protein
MKISPKAKSLYKEFKKRKLLTDRREYDIEDLAIAYKINFKVANDLYLLLHK